MAAGSLLTIAPCYNKSGIVFQQTVFDLLNLLLLLLLLLLTAIQLSLGGSSPYTSTEKTNKSKYT